MIAPADPTGAAGAAGPAVSAGSVELADERSRRTLLGQVGLVLGAFGVLGGGLVIAWVGTHGVFVPSDLAFLHDRSGGLTQGNPRLLPLLAHDRAGFGGALVSFAVGLLVLVTRAWRPGAYWVWVAVFSSALIGTGSTLVVHYSVGYVDQLHLAPVYLLDALVAGSLLLAAPALLRRRSATPPSHSSPSRSSPSSSSMPSAQAPSAAV